VADLEPLPETVQLTYEHTRTGPARQSATGDAIDSKAFQIFSAATIVLGLGTFATPHIGALGAVLYGCGAAAYAVAGERAWRVLRARQYQVVDGADRWWPTHRLAETNYVREQMLADIAEADTFNRALLDKKGAPLDVMLVAVAVEAGFVAAAVIASLV
jgi:hypothetical protein